ncbi:hypothetical protein XM38_025310 [Halomicronema hongdechloris C2206]|uniref:Uncharacterized protein n=1 Tax=Halomicronema hongdechloris C2206 TaxID=1641165 RepID=A0A1Z3HMQ4_9CYAN|nr:hypothetical protein [Halomicronema hongdechloris]ASC71579.1 hypothetical protein XM38_025310 [Halomicronema hongdechloris C2206]
MATLSSFFDRIYILNLPHRVDRRKATIKELESIGVFLKPEKIEVFPAIKPDKAEPFKKLGSKGCFLSVLAILGHVRDEGANNVLIFQDDIKFPPFFNKHESSLIQQLELQNWDIAQFGHLTTEIDDADIKDKFATWRDSESKAIGAHFFAVNGKSLDRFIHFLEELMSRPSGHPEGGAMPIDGAFTVFRRQNPDIVRLLAIPSFGGQRSSRSDVTPKWFDKLPVTSNLAQLYRHWIYH